MKNYLFLAPGFEEIEAVAPIDILRRAGVEVITVAVTSDNTKTVKGAHNIPVEADIHINELTDDTLSRWMILPGGMPGADNLHKSARVNTMLRQARRLAAICAAPAMVLGRAGLLRGHRATCYPGFEVHCLGAKMTGRPVEVSGNIITSKGPGFAVEFALAIVREECGAQVAEQVASGMLL